MQELKCFAVALERNPDIPDRLAILSRQADLLRSLEVGSAPKEDMGAATRRLQELADMVHDCSVMKVRCAYAGRGGLCG